MLVPLLLPTTLMAQGDAWTTFIRAWPRTNPRPITLLVPKGQADLDRSDEQVLFLTVTEDLGSQWLEGRSLEALREARGWKGGPHWVLLGQDGSLLGEGGEPPKGEYLLGRLQAAGHTPTWEALEQFLHLHPDHGPALRQRLRFAAGVARLRFRNLEHQGKAATPAVSGGSWSFELEPARLVDPAPQGEWCREVEETLHRLNRLPDPWRLGERDGFTFWLKLYGKAIPPGLRGELAGLADATLEAWRDSPHSGRDLLQPWQDEGMGLGSFWMAVAGASLASRDLPELPRLLPSPGRFWPHGDLLMGLPMPQPGGGNAREVLAFLDGLAPQEAEPLLWNDSWSEWLVFRAQVSIRRAVALASLGRWSEAALTLQEVRRLTGKRWPEAAGPLLATYAKQAAAKGAGPADDPARPAAPGAFLEVLGSPPMGDLPPPRAPEPLRFLVWGRPDWASRWEALRATPPLAPWGASELRLETPGEADTARLARAGFPATGWAVFQGDSILARGESAPEAATLALQLRSVAPSRIHRYDGFVTRHPEHLDARRDRYALVRSRMPQAALEARLQEDAARAFLPLDFGPGAPWISDLDGWRAQARKVVPGLEAGLQRWPDHAGLWRAWVSWAAFLPRPPALLPFAAGLPVFGFRDLWSGLLPAEVHRAVARECRERRQYGPMADWFEGAWSGLASRLRPTDSPSRVGEREKAIFEGYREALTGLGRIADRVELERGWASLQPGSKKGAPS